MKNNIFWVGGGLVAISIALNGGAYYLITDEKVDINSNDSNLTDLQKFLEKEQEYEEKVTTFKPENYNLPKSNPSNLVEVGACVNGFGGELPKIHKGLFSEPLYSFKAEKIAVDSGDGYGYAPYVNSYTLIGDILFKKPIDAFDRKLITEDSLFRGFSNLNTVYANKTYKNSYLTMESKFGFPQSYLRQQAGGVVSLSSFNDECAKGVALYDMTFRKFDLSGIPIASILSTNYKTTLHHGVNGLYNFTQKSPDFVSTEFLEWVQSNNRLYQSILGDTGTQVFPKDSYVYFPIKHEIKAESVVVDFNSKPLGESLNGIKARLTKEFNLTPREIYIIEENVSGFKILKFVKPITFEPINNFAVAEKDGHFYLAKWSLPTSYEIDGSEDGRSDLVLFNEIAMGAAVGLFKSKYQGKQLDVGTENENLNQRFMEATSPEAQEELNRKKEEILGKLVSNKDEKLSNKIEDNTIKIK